MAIISNFLEKMKSIKGTNLKPILQDFVNQGVTLDDFIETIRGLCEEEYKGMFSAYPMPREHFTRFLTFKFKEVQG